MNRCQLFDNYVSEEFCNCVVVVIYHRFAGYVHEGIRDIAICICECNAFAGS